MNLLAISVLFAVVLIVAGMVTEDLGLAMIGLGLLAVCVYCVQPAA